MRKFSFAFLIEEADILITNASSHPEIKQKLSVLGYNPKNLQTGKALLANLILLQEAKKTCYLSRQEISEGIRTDIQNIKVTLKNHLKLAEVAFGNDAGSVKRLGLKKPRAYRQLEWITQTKDFYTELLKQPEPILRYVEKAELEQALASLEGIAEARRQRMQRKGEAENATQKRNEAKKELQRWIRSFKSIVRVALQGDEQLLEVLGMAVAS